MSVILYKQFLCDIKNTVYAYFSSGLFHRLLCIKPTNFHKLVLFLLSSDRVRTPYFDGPLSTISTQNQINAHCISLSVSWRNCRLHSHFCWYRMDVKQVPYLQQFEDCCTFKPTSAKDSKCYHQLLHTDAYLQPGRTNQALTIPSMQPASTLKNRHL
jgi:hypothetical protein